MIFTTPGATTTDTLSGGGLTTGLTITARLKDGDETLATVVTITLVLDADDLPLPAYKATFIAPTDLPVVLEYVLAGEVIGSDIVDQLTPVPVVVDPSLSSRHTSYQAGDTYSATVTIRDEAGTPTAPQSLTLKVRDQAGTVTTYTYGTDDLIQQDSVGVYHANVLLSAPGMWALSWSTTDEAQVAGVQIAVSAAPTANITFATLDELALRLGLAGAGELTDAQTAQGQMLLELVTGVIVDEVDRDDEWAATLSPIPRVVRSVCLEAVARVMQNPTGVSSESEALGAWSHTTRFASSGPNTASALGLSDAEIRMCRRAILGTLSGSASLDSLATRLATNVLTPPTVLLEEGADDPPVYDDWAN